MDSIVAIPSAGQSDGAALLRSVSIAGPEGRLEALLNEGNANPPFAALVCHPHPKGGGTMHNKVVYHAMKVLNDPAWGFAFPVLRFNFRGVGLSEGAHDGRAEAGDVRAAIDWLVNEYNLPLIVAGFSFGAAMAIEACCGRGYDVRALAILGLPTQAGSKNYEHPALSSCAISKLFLSGDHDQFAPAEQLRQIAAAAAEPRRLEFIAGADHFFTGQLGQMQSALAGWLEDQAQ